MVKKCPFCKRELEDEEYEAMRLSDFQNRAHPIDSFTLDEIIKAEKRK